MQCELSTMYLAYRWALPQCHSAWLHHWTWESTSAVLFNYFWPTAFFYRSPTCEKSCTTWRRTQSGPTRRWPWPPAATSRPGPPSASESSELVMALHLRYQEFHNIAPKELCRRTILATLAPCFWSARKLQRLIIDCIPMRVLAQHATEPLECMNWRLNLFPIDTI